ncbi:AAA-like domain-containing protein [candidate division KSB1 bacterium]|nr:AAA-like domain-containing protein [candidate division KSB1 bacterium]
MREFNVEGPCYPDLHYMVRREALIQRGIEKVKKGKYFTIFAPRQAGKTTYFLELLREIERTEGSSFLPVWITIEGLHNSGADFMKFFKIKLLDRTKNAEVKKIIENCKLVEMRDFVLLMREIYKQTQKRMALVIDEFDALPDDRISETMHLFRSMYHERDVHSLHSLMLVGVRNLSGVVLDHASPFNVADELEVPYFTKAEVEDLISQYEQESEQKFQKKVVAKIYDNTLGQPGLVNALCRELVEKYCTDRNKPVDMASFRKLLDYFLTERIDRNISNIVSKAREHKDFMIKVLFGDSPMPFSVYDEQMKFLNSHGVIAKDEEGNVDVPIPLYKNVLIAAFRPKSNGEAVYYTDPNERFEDFYTTDGLNIDQIVRHYIAYIQRRGFRAFDTKNLKESACHYSFDTYINFFVEQLGGKTFMEVPTRRGRLDTIIVYKDKAYVIEIKRWIDAFSYQKGKRQLAEYAKSEGLADGYYVVFSSRHKESDTLFEQEEIDGTKIHTYVVRTNFERPSKLPAKRRSKNKKQKS